MMPTTNKTNWKYIWKILCDFIADAIFLKEKKNNNMDMIIMHMSVL